SADHISIAQRDDGGLDVSINGQTQSFSAEQSAKLVIDGGQGDDTIIADSSVKARLFITGGQGNDTIIGGSGDDFIIDSYGRNTISGQAGNDSIISSGLDLPQAQPASSNALAGGILLGCEGNDYIEGSGANDYIDGGEGNNVLYGLDGNDTIKAGSGRNYIDGGRGDDTIANAGAQGMLFGGQGNDSIISDQRASIIADGYGQNQITAPNGADKAWQSADSSWSGDQADEHNISVPTLLPNGFTISGSEAFKARVQSDLDTLQQIGLGQKMLGEIAKTGKQVTIKETSNNGNQCNSSKDGHLRDDKTPGPGTSSVISYNRAGTKIDRTNVQWAERPPLVGLFHELAHSYNAATGTMDYGAYRYDGTAAPDRRGLVGAEYQAVGIEHPLINGNPDGLNENGMRRFLGIAERTRYYTRLVPARAIYLCTIRLMISLSVCTMPTRPI
ncbi:hypothetical protein IJT17_08595, partial [bacterium]|nr:hypothetical protein [bacterium]